MLLYQTLKSVDASHKSMLQQAPRGQRSALKIGATIGYRADATDMGRSRTSKEQILDTTIQWCLSCYSFAHVLSTGHLDVALVHESTAAPTPASAQGLDPS